MSKNLSKREQVKKFLKEGMSSREIIKHIHCGPQMIVDVRKEIQDMLNAPKNGVKMTKEEKQKLKMLEGLSLKEIKELLHQATLNTQKNITETIGEPGHLRFGLVSDTHFGSKVSAIDELGEFYDKAKDKGVECFMHAGDVCEGHDIYRGQIFELDKLGAEEQVKLVVDKYPNVGLNTYFILGNHDEGFLKSGNIDIGKMISRLRKDLIYLGFYNARVRLNGIDIDLHHGAGGNAYARSYKIQKMAENINPKDQPHIYAVGHWHTALYQFYRKMHLFLPGAFQKATLLSKRLGLDNTVGGWVIDIEIDNKGGTNIYMEFIKI